MPSDDPSHKFTPTPPSQNEYGNDQTHTQSNSVDRPGTQDALRGQGNSHARTEIPRDQVAPAQGASQSGKESYNKEDRSNVAGQKEANQERSIPSYVTTGKDESEAGKTGGPTEGKVKQPPKDNKANLVEAGTTMAGDADAYGGLRNTA
ncbi:hypothetical protein JCM5353_007214 [Sporobolomyces roseus]